MGAAAEGGERGAEGRRRRQGDGRLRIIHDGVARWAGDVVKTALLLLSPSSLNKLHTISIASPSKQCTLHFLKQCFPFLFLRS